MMRILVVDDSPHDRALVSRALEKNFDRVDVVEIGALAALDDELARGNFDLVVTDYHLKWSDGLRVLAGAKARCPQAPVIMFTATGNEEIAVAGMKAGLDDYVLKSPAHYGQLVAAVRRALGLANERRNTARERARAERAEERLQQMIMSSPNALVLFAFVAQDQQRMHRLQPLIRNRTAERLGDPFVDALRRVLDDEADAASGATLAERVIAADGVHRCDVTLTIGGDERHFLTQVMRTAPDELAIVAMDDTERRQAEEERARLLEREQLASRIKDEFLATVSHELRTPLSAILGWTTLLQGDRGHDPAAIRRGLEVIERNARAQSRLIEDILDVSSIVRGKLHVESEPVDIEPIAHDAMDAIRPAAQAKNIALRFEGCRGSCRVLADPDRLRQILWNLLSNAVKFTPDRGEVELGVALIDGRIVISVRDTGEGIDRAFLPFVFDQFRQADATTTRRYGGLGLGLSIVRYLVEMHGGTIIAESEGVGKGSTFTVTLPVRAVHVSSSDAPRSGVRAGALAGLRVLVVEDETDSRELIAMVLADENAEVATAANAREALQLVSGFDPDVLVSDIAMSGHDGYWLVERARSQNGSLPAIALTAHARDADVARAEEAGFDLHLAKPIDARRLVEAVRSLRRPPDAERHTPT